jgi:hypothetical protein
MIEIQPLCEAGVLFEVEEQCSLVYIMKDDGRWLGCDGIIKTVS